VYLTGELVLAGLLWLRILACGNRSTNGDA
jgi:hypothetical protein